MKTTSRTELREEAQPSENRGACRFSWILPTSCVLVSAFVSMIYPGQCFEKPDFGASSKSTSIKLADFARPESGVKLLNGIFGRLSQPQLAKNSERQGDNKIALRQLAMANNAQQLKNSQFGGVNASAESTDPALAIRPQAARKIAVGRTIIDRAIPIEGITIAMAPQKSAAYKKGAAQSYGSTQSYGTAQGYGSGISRDEARLQAQGQVQTGQSQYQSLGANIGAAGAGGAAGGSSVALSGAPAAAPSQMVPASPMSKAEMADDRRKSDAQYFRQGQTNIIAQNSPYVKDFSQSQPVVTNYRGNPKQLMEESGADRKGEGADTANGIIRPTEQPGLFKYVREHGKELPRDIPGSYGREASKVADLRERKDADAEGRLAAENEKADKLTSAGKAKRSYQVLDSEHDIALENKEGTAVQIAFLPPNTVHGLNGLPLGASEEEVNRFLKNKGSLNKATVSGWKIWTLVDNRLNPQIQVYLRGGKAEAFRIYSQSYVPSGLGLSLSDELSLMKSKFGEPAFILEEPGVRSVMAKNYVYPVSQVSFQLVRTGSGSAPQILSLLLFRYL